MTRKPADTETRSDSPELEMTIEQMAMFLALLDQWHFPWLQGGELKQPRPVVFDSLCQPSFQQLWVGAADRPAGDVDAPGNHDDDESKVGLATKIETLLARASLNCAETGSGKTLFLARNPLLSHLRLAGQPAEKKAEGGAAANDDRGRLELLAAAAGGAGDPWNPLQKLDAAVWADTIDLLGGKAVLGRSIADEETLVEALAAGLPAEVIATLRQAGYPPTILEQVVAPRRTLRRRKAERQRLTRAESDAAWRLAHVLALATRVLDGRKAALSWLSRPKPGMGGRTPVDLLETSVGTAYIERILRSLDWGDVA